MTIHLDHLLVLGLLGAATHWLIARSEIARPLWSRARGMLNQLLRCAGCSGTWIGTILGVAGIRPVVWGTSWWAVGLSASTSAVLATVLTPVLEAVMLWGLAISAIEETPASEEVTPVERHTPPPA